MSRKAREKRYKRRSKDIDYSNYEDYCRRVEEIKQSIKHPRFYYASWDSKTDKVTYHRKKWYQWFNKKRLVKISIITVEWTLEPYYRSNEKS